jgi:Ankyrin repeats (3 copies)
MKCNCLLIVYLVVVIAHMSSGMDKKYDKELLEAVKVNNLEKMRQLLIHYNANVNTQDTFGWAPLHYAVDCAIKTSDTKVIELLIKHKASINIRNDLGYTPIYIATSYNCIGIVLLLLNHGATINALNNEVSTLLDFAILLKKRKTIELLKKYLLVEQETYNNPTREIVEKTIKLNFTLLMSLLFEKLAIQPTQEHLKLAKECGSKEVGRLLIGYLGIINMQPLISKTGIKNVAGLNIPEEIVELIVSYTL